MGLAALLLVLASASAGAGTIAFPPASTAPASASSPSVGPGAVAAPEADRRPNIVLVMADDMGFTDIGCYGGEI